MPEPHHLVHDGCARGVGHAGETHRLARGALPDARAEHATHQHFVDSVGFHARVRRGGLDGAGAELRRGLVGEGAEKAADRRALRAEYEDIVHGSSFLLCALVSCPASLCDYWRCLNRGINSAKLQGLKSASSWSLRISSQPVRQALVEPGSAKISVPLAKPPNARDWMVELPIWASETCRKQLAESVDGLVEQGPQGFRRAVAVREARAARGEDRVDARIGYPRRYPGPDAVHVVDLYRTPDQRVSCPQQTLAEDVAGGVVRLGAGIRNG